MKETLAKMERFGVIPVVVLDRKEDACPMAQALCDGGLPVAEITFRTAAAERSIAQIAKEFPAMCVGAGTVLHVEQAERAVAAGAQFIVSPGFSKEIVDYCIQQKIPVFPGAVTPSEVMQIVDAGLEVVKFFPAEPMGGLSAIKAIAAPFPMLRFMPTGGINDKNIRAYLEDPKIIACGGSWMVKKDLIMDRETEKIKQMTSDIVSLVKEVRG